MKDYIGRRYVKKGWLPMITPQDIVKFQNGIHYTIYEKLGAHSCVVDGEQGTYFAVWAPAAKRISVVGDFNGWDGGLHQMQRFDGSDIYELFVREAKPGDSYKYEIEHRSGAVCRKADPYGNAAKLRPENASVITDLHEFTWEDQEFIDRRTQFQGDKAPISVYEMYPGSFAAADAGAQFVNFRELAPKVISYVKKMGYTHVELLPVMEHPLDESWGYQVTGYYAPTARYGTPQDFMYFVNELHKAGIGVILDWVPAHFPKDEHGLSCFDGTYLYEYSNPQKREHPHWGTLIFDYEKPEVVNFLIANALFWVEKFHADGLRVDAVSSMLYLNFGRSNGEWMPNIHGEQENLEAIEMLKRLNSIMKKSNPGVLMIAEESTAFPNVTGSLSEGALGFDLKWNMGYTHDYLQYIHKEPDIRNLYHDDLIFSMIYAYRERYMLVYSHDEVVHCKSTLLGKMPGEKEEKLANLRLTYAYMMTHPGKKLLFMGQDIGEWYEWNEHRQVQWELLKHAEHAGLAELVKDLNFLYRGEKALYELDSEPAGFEWINNISADDCRLAFLRKGKAEEDTLLVVANFSGTSADVGVGVPYVGSYREILNTNDKKYGGTGLVNIAVQKAMPQEYDDRHYSLKVKLAPLSVSIWKLAAECS